MTRFGYKSLHSKLTVSCEVTKFLYDSVETESSLQLEK